MESSPHVDERASGPSACRTVRRQVASRLCAVAIVLLGTGLVGGHILRRLSPPPTTPFLLIPSPNCSDRPAGTSVSAVVLHATVVRTTEAAVRILLDTRRPPARRVSAHFVVGKDGQVVQMVPIERRAWHAGPSMLDGVPNVNDYSIGIEMVNANDGEDPYTEEQYRAVARIVRFLRLRYAIPDRRIVSHAQIAAAVGRHNKTDPRGFDFGRLYALARGGVRPPGGG
jgi:N-acetylmuramoyl-L-alanine amidase/AmpD protein